jgi:3-oxoadipate enol-lactonase
MGLTAIDEAMSQQSGSGESASDPTSATKPLTTESVTPRRRAVRSVDHALDEHSPSEPPRRERPRRTRRGETLADVLPARPRRRPQTAPTLTLPPTDAPAASQTIQQRGPAPSTITFLSSAKRPNLPEREVLDLGARGTLPVRYWPAPPGAPTLVLLHGWTATADLNWFRAYDALTESFGVVTFDHRGHGTGLRSRKGFKMADCADDAVAVMDALGLSDAIICGYSMGGAVAQLVWQRHPSRVRGLVLCATAGTFSTSFNEQLQFLGLTGLAAVSRLAPEVLRNRLVDQYLTKRQNDGWQDWAIEQLKGHDWVKLLEAGHALGTFSSMDWIGTVNVPCTTVITEGDLTVPTWRQQALADSIDGAVSFAYPGMHNSCATDPEKFVPTLMAAVHHVDALHHDSAALPAGLTALVESLSTVRGVEAIGFGGSRSTGGSRATSDWDLGVYYRPKGRKRLDVDALRAVVEPFGELNAPGQWGPVMNGGAWLTVGGLRVDVLLRDLDVIDAVRRDAGEGVLEIRDMPGHIAGAPMTMLLAEVAANRWLFGSVDTPEYSDALRLNGAAMWRWRSAFSLTHAKKHAARGEVTTAVGHAAKAIIEEAQARACERGMWTIGEKRLLAAVGLADIANEQFDQMSLERLPQWLLTVERSLDRLA